MILSGTYGANDLRVFLGMSLLRANWHGHVHRPSSQMPSSAVTGCLAAPVVSSWVCCQDEANSGERVATARGQLAARIAVGEGRRRHLNLTHVLARREAYRVRWR